MKNGRLFELLYLLVERRALTAGELAERFEVSERTIYRDVDALSAAGVPVYTQRGQGGGIRLMDQFVLDRCLLSPREQDEVLFALRALLSTGGLEGAEALERLSALFRREAEGWVEVDFTDWGSGEQERENFRIVREGILERRLLDFTYYASSAPAPAAGWSRASWCSNPAAGISRRSVLPGGTGGFFDLRGWRGCVWNGRAFLPDGRRSSWRFLPRNSGRMGP